jgi:3-oxoacyl-[acyl-carrier protein] reductase
MPVASQIVDTGLSGKRVLVTGASGGIGAACAREFAAEGAHVLVHFNRGADRAAAVAAEVGGETVQADLTDDAQVDSLFEAAGHLDVCAAIAGLWPTDDVPVWELPLERWEATLRANLTSSFLTARGFLRGVATSGHGNLVLIGSTAALFGEAGHADYAAAKSGLVGLMLSMKNEVVRVAPLARVNAVFPGWTVSEMTRGHVDDEQVRRISRTMALRKVARPEDVARQVVVLSSDELSGHVTGQVITVAGGMEGRVLHEN